MDMEPIFIEIEPDRLYSLAQAGGILDLSLTTVRKYIKARRLVIHRPYGHIRVTGASLLALLDELEAAESRQKGTTAA